MEKNSETENKNYTKCVASLDLDSHSVQEAQHISDVCCAQSLHTKKVLDISAGLHEIEETARNSHEIQPVNNTESQVQEAWNPQDTLNVVCEIVVAEGTRESGFSAFSPEYLVKEDSSLVHCASAGVIPEKFWQRKVTSEHDCTQVLVDIVKQEKIQELLKRRTVTKHKVWGMIAEEMAQRGAAVPASSSEEAAKKCHQKWRNLEYVYLKYKQQSWEKDCKRKVHPRYFDDVDAVMSKKVKEVPQPPSNEVPAATNQSLFMVTVPNVQPVLLMDTTGTTSPVLTSEEELNTNLCDNSRSAPEILTNNIESRSRKLGSASKPRSQYREFMSFLKSVRENEAKVNEKRHSEFKSLIEAQNTQLQVQNTLLEAQNKQRQELVDIFQLCMVKNRKIVKS